MKNLLRITIIFSIAINIISAQVSLNIEDGVKVETSGNVFVELSGELNENITGYLEGTVTSGNRGSDALNQFAGLSISSGAVDKITRITGSALSNSAPKTALRIYEVENTTAINSDILTAFKNSLEGNGILDPFLYSNVSTSWDGYLDTHSSVDSIGASNFNIPSGSSSIVISEGVGVAAKIFLEGPYTSNAMSTSLSGNIPLTSPYAEDSRTVTSIPSNAVDWILVELRDKTTPSTIISSRSVFLKNDGNIIDDLGGTSIGMPSSPDDYYIGVKHRNHLQVMSNEAQTVDWLTP